MSVSAERGIVFERSYYGSTLGLRVVLGRTFELYQIAFGADLCYWLELRVVLRRCISAAFWRIVARLWETIAQVRRKPLAFYLAKL